MKTVTQSFIDAATAQSGNPIWRRTVSYKRRYWQESTHSYVWETNWTDMSETDVSEISPISWQLDTQNLNEFRASTVQLKVIDQDNQWKPDNRAGKFGPDSVSPVGYEWFWTKFRIQVSVKKYDTNYETVTLFTGLLQDYNDDSDSGINELTLYDPISLLINGDAEKVSTTVTNETAGTGDGANKDFVTAHSAVGIISEVSVNGIKKRPGADYTAGNMNLSGTPAGIHFVAAPANATTIRVSYVYWKTSRTFEAFVADLATQAGIAAGNQQIQPVIFASQVINSHSYQLQSDWDAGAKTDIDTSTLVNSIKMDFSGTGARQATTWGASLTGWTQNANNGGFFNDAGSNVKYANGDAGGSRTGSLGRAQAKGSGRWDMTFKSTLHQSGQRFRWYFFVQNMVSANVSYGYGGYMLNFDLTTSPSVPVKLSRVDSSTFPGDSGNALLGSATLSLAQNVDHTVSVSRFPSGRILVVIDGSTVFDVADTTYSTCTYQVLDAEGILHGQTFYLGDGTIYVPADTMTSTWISPTFDSSSTPTAWSQVTDAETPIGGAITLYTRSSPDNITYDADVAVVSNINGSTLRRYLKLRIDLTATLVENDDPTVSSASVGSYSTSTNITMGNFTGKTCLEAIQALAGFANYEMGFDSTEHFFFRPKRVAADPVASLDERVIASVPSVVPGADRLYTHVRATYGVYQVDAQDDGLTRIGPAARAVASRLDLDGGDILISDDADVATGIATSLLQYYRTARRRPRIICSHFLPHLDLSDVISVTFSDNRDQVWYLGDTTKYLGDTSLHLHGDAEQLLANLPCKVVGARFDTDNWQCEFELEEVA